ncbi:hypothetical protein ACFFR3_20705 [Nonomuraea salmonea]|uniref:C2H2-type domain-containing protein n=1 Tax=Nonomuraea salmonea TaxID=46181 RepID=A0ABV5NNQ8_9ACTN
MRDEFESRESWPFECLRCLHVWEEDYVVRHLSDGHGHTVQVWLRHGVPVQPPWSGPCCPACGSSSLTSFPPGYLDRHPELVAADPLPPARVPALPVEPARQRPAVRAGLPRRLLIVTGLPVLALVAYELYRYLLISGVPHH